MPSLLITYPEFGFSIGTGNHHLTPEFSLSQYADNVWPFFPLCSISLAKRFALEQESDPKLKPGGLICFERFMCILEGLKPRSAAKEDYFGFAILAGYS